MSKTKGKEILERLRAGEVILADGAPNVAILQNGLSISGGTARHNIDHYDLMAKLHKDYAVAGSKIAFANTLHASRDSLSHKGLEGKIESINTKGIMAAKESGNPVFGLVTADYCGMVGNLGCPMSHVVDRYAEQIRYLVKAECDAIYLLTHVSYDEAACAIVAAKEYAPGLPLILSFSFGHQSSSDRPVMYDTTLMGAKVDGVVSRFKDQVDILGFNCGISPKYAPQIVAAFRKITDMPLIIQPNAGKPQMDGIVYETNPVEFAGSIQSAIAQNNGRGGLIVGGCCGTTPEYIKAIREIMH